MADINFRPMFFFSFLFFFKWLCFLLQSYSLSMYLLYQDMSVSVHQASFILATRTVSSVSISIPHLCLSPDFPPASDTLKSQTQPCCYWQLFKHTLSGCFQSIHLVQLLDWCQWTHSGLLNERVEKKAIPYLWYEWQTFAFSPPSPPFGAQPSKQIFISPMHFVVKKLY